jgi:aminopeptidase N
VLCLALAGVAGPGGSQDPETGYRLLYGEKQARLDRLGIERASLAEQAEGDAGWDVQHYVIDIEIDPVAQSIAGSVSVRFAVTAATLDTVSLHLNDGLNVSGVFEDATPRAYARGGGVIDIDLGGPRALDDTVTVTVNYDGFPAPPGLRFHARAVYNLSEPDYARNWFPCYDEPWDKATSEMICTVPDDRVCASNGLLVSEVNNGDGTKTYHWSTRYRLATYLVSVAISGYTSWSDWFHYSPTDSMEMPYYVYPYKEAAARIDFAPTPAMMQFFSDTFGMYPYVEEKYGTAMAEVGGGMENFTCTTYGQVLVTGDNRYDWVVAHEVAHSWWGNSVTMADWPDIWLNEGFATYSDALWSEHIGGPAELNARMEGFKAEYFDEDTNDGRFPIYDPVILFGATVYEKGAWILHMLRYVVGDTTFFDILRTYQSTYAHSNADTEQFKAVCEAVSGMDLTAFFDEWVYQAGFPWYGYSWLTYEAGGYHYVRARVIQVQTSAPVFTIPVEFMVSTTAGDTTVRVPVASNDDSFLIRVDDPVVGVTFDPGNHILKLVNPISVAADAPGRPPALSAAVVPNPGGRRVQLQFLLPEDGDVVLEIYDVKGRLAGRITREGLTADRHAIELFDERPGLDLGRSGVYFYRITSGPYVGTGKFTLLR